MADTVAAYSWLPSQTPLPPSTPDCTTQFCSLLDYQSGSGATNSPLPTIPVNFLEDALTETTVSVGANTITISNNAPAGTPFCPISGSCGYDGFEFIFSSGVNLTGATVDAASASDFLPNSTGTHLGLYLVSPTELWVDVSNDAPALGDNLIIDLSSATTTTVFTRTVSGNWTDTTGWTPNGVPNGTTVTAQLVNPGSGTNSVNLGGGTFTVNQLQFSGTNAGTWNVTNGTIVFDGTNPTFLNQGDSSGLTGSLPNLQLNATTTFEIDNASAVTEVTGAVAGTGGLIKTGNGTLILTGTNNYSGGTTISSGTLQISNGGTTGSITGNVADNGVLAFDRSDTVTFAGAINGTGALTQLGTGTTILTGANTYTGGTTLTGGTLVVGNSSALGSGTLSMANGTALSFVSGTTVNIANNITVAGDPTFVTTPGTPQTISGTISDATGPTPGDVVVNGGGVLTLSGQNTYSLGTTISGSGTTVVVTNSAPGTSSSIGTGALTLDGGVLKAGANNLSFNNGIALNSTGGTIDANGNSLTWTGAITNGNGTTGGLTIANTGGANTGVVTFTNTNTYTGATTINSGATLALLGTGSIAASSGVADNGTFDISALTGGTSIVSLSGNGTVSLGANTLTLSNGGGTFAGAIGGTGGLTILAGTETLGGTNTYSGTTTINSGLCVPKS